MKDFLEETLELLGHVVWELFADPPIFRSYSDMVPPSSVKPDQDGIVNLGRIPWEKIALIFSRIFLQFDPL